MIKPDGLDDDSSESENPLRVIPNLGLPLGIGLFLITLFFGGFGAWALLTELDSAAVAPGVLIVESNRKTVNHLEGGIVSDILVREGDRVEAGDILLRLDPTQAEASLELLNSRRMTALARMSRLEAERDGLETISFPDALAQAPEGTNLAKQRESEMNIFRSRAESRAGQVSILGQQVAAFEEEIGGLEDQIEAETRQLSLIKSEIDDLDTLYKKGLARKSRMLALERERAQIQGQRAQNRAEVARIRQSIGETQIRVRELEVEFVNEVVAELAAVQSELFDLEERIPAALDVLRRTEVIAPSAGIVLGLQIHTKGGVLAPGEPILDVIPEGEKLVIDARVDPADADVVRPGLDAMVSFSAFSGRDSKPSGARVTWISADGVQDEQTGASYYLTRVELDVDRLEGITLADLRPGMLADVFILTGAQTPFDYLTGPLMRNLQKSLREQ
ncbi:MAG: HlyD family type I secretion periplasmic adaptor subunit [Magnetovibrionaceae bacterium]